MSYFITGTDTGAGKTLVSCALLHAFAAQGRRVAGFKPVAAGCDEDDHNEDAKLLRAAGSIQATYGQVNPYCFPHAIAPHLAARHVGVRIEFPRILASYRELAGQTDEVIAEGAGGFLVPLNDRQTSADLAKQLDLPVILVVGMRLGCLNHALLTVRAIADYQLECAGWVANVLDAGMPALQENIDALRERIAAPLLGIIPHQAMPDARAASAHLNLELLEKKQIDG
ncbi:ATP-dependent dethiobiotin synthetase BioD 1 [Sideroxyarcus emersonii]|uniref:ATP-dependent dethiobiotin synthetase BioD n=1 Tax=Sideroxyarcus emersonii TaxID=2764705 RepID=A0AAN2C076_9PROT|nr:dethiobiotin synthase [Sideroxyarcus emersonii]BCK88552.1 ATP-dependent dethiobiotin synthetase BioD 1 [Sideroxyarcus emersonii]